MTTQHAYSAIMSNLHLSLQQQGLTILYRIEIQVFLIKIHCYFAFCTSRPSAMLFTNQITLLV